MKTKQKAARALSMILALIMLLGTFSMTVSSEKADADYDWQGKWIWTTDSAPTGQVGQFINLRKTFTLNEVPSSAIARISVESRYWMWINGEMVVYEGQLKMGPTSTSWYYDVVDLAPYLKKGENTVAVLAAYYGHQSASAKPTKNPAFLFDAEFSAGALETGTRLVSDASWKVIKNPAYEPPVSSHNGKPDGVNTKYNAKNAIEGWQSPEFDDSKWANAKVKTLSATDPRKTLVERSIPQWKVEEIVKYGADDWTVSGSTTKVYSIYNPTNMQGTPYLKVRSATGGETIKLSSDSTAHNGGESVVHWYVTKAGEQEYEAYGWMSGWRVDFTMPSTVEVLELGWRQSSYNTEHTGYVTTDSEKLNQLYQEAYDTLLITMRDIYMDCPDRERQQWWGDAVIEMQQAAYAMDEDAGLLYKKLLTQAVGFVDGRGGALSCVPTNPNFMEMPGQCLAGVHSLWQYYLYYGETDILETCYDTFFNYLKLWNFDERGYMNHRSGTSDWFDWGGTIDAAVTEYCWYYAAAESMKNVAKVLGKDQADVKFLEDRMALMEESFVSMFWDEDLGAYFSNTSKGTPDERAQSMAVYVGLADPAHYPSILKFLQKASHAASPYGEKYILEALYMMGYAEEAVTRTLNRYNEVLSDGFPTLPEGFTAKGLSGTGGTGTRNHAWSGGPLSLMYMYNAGILSTGAGFKTVQIRPMLGTLTQVSASTDTPSGTITVEATKNTLTVTVPTGCTSAEICVPRLEKATTVKLGGAVIYANGKASATLPAGVTYSGEDTGFVNFTVIPGTYAFTMSEDAADSAASHTVTISAVGNGTVKVNGTAVQLPYTGTVSDSVTVTATPNAGSRVAYIAGSSSETLYSEAAVERTYTLDRDMGIKIVFDEPAADNPVIKIVDTTRDFDKKTGCKSMFYAFRLFVNGEEIYLDHYVRDGILSLPYFVTAKKGETVTVSIKPVAESNYAVMLFNESERGASKDEFTFIMDEDVELNISLVERAGVKKIPIKTVTSNYPHSTSGSWALTNLIDGYRISTEGSVSGMASKGYASEIPDEPITITLDLGSVQLINQLSLFPRNAFLSLTGGARCFPKDFTISISEDGERYYTVKTVTDQPDPHIHQQVYDFDSVHARYVKITVTKLGAPDYHVGGSTSYRIQLTEAEVAYVKPLPAPTTPTTPTNPEDVTTDTAESETTGVGNDGGKKKGCFSTASVGLATILSMAAAACVCRKQKRD